MKNIITWFSTYQEKMKKRTLRIHRNIEAARLRRARRKRGLAYTYCKNCGTKLKGMYCHRCGQYAWIFTSLSGNTFSNILKMSISSIQKSGRLYG